MIPETGASAFPNGRPPGPAASALIGLITSLANAAGTGIVRWYVEVKLDIPLSFAVSQRQEVNIVNRAQG